MTTEVANVIDKAIHKGEVAFQVNEKHWLFGTMDVDNPQTYTMSKYSRLDNRVLLYGKGMWIGVL